MYECLSMTLSMTLNIYVYVHARCIYKLACNCKIRVKFCAVGIHACINMTNNNMGSVVTQWLNKGHVFLNQATKLKMKKGMMANLAARMVTTFKAKSLLFFIFSTVDNVSSPYWWMYIHYIYNDYCNYNDYCGRYLACIHILTGKWSR